MARELLAAYGTLMDEVDLPGQPDLSACLRPAGPCVIPGALHDLGRGYPGLVAEDGLVRGELYEVCDAEILPVLDAYEDSEYERRRVRLVEPEEDAWVYLYTGEVPPGSRIDDGDWRMFLALRGDR